MTAARLPSPTLVALLAFLGSAVPDGAHAQDYPIAAGPPEIVGFYDAVMECRSSDGAAAGYDAEAVLSGYADGQYRLEVTDADSGETVVYAGLYVEGDYYPFRFRAVSPERPERGDRSFLLRIEPDGTLASRCAPRLERRIDDLEAELALQEEWRGRMEAWSAAPTLLDEAAARGDRAWCHAFQRWMNRGLAITDPGISLRPPTYDLFTDELFPPAFGDAVDRVPEDDRRDAVRRWRRCRSQHELPPPAPWVAEGADDAREWEEQILTLLEEGPRSDRRARQRLEVRERISDLMPRALRAFEELPATVEGLEAAGRIHRGLGLVPPESLMSHLWDREKEAVRKAMERYLERAAGELLPPVMDSLARTLGDEELGRLESLYEVPARFPDRRRGAPSIWSDDPYAVALEILPGAVSLANGWGTVHIAAPDSIRQAVAHELRWAAQEGREKTRARLAELEALEPGLQALSAGSEWYAAATELWPEHTRLRIDNEDLFERFRELRVRNLEAAESAILRQIHRADDAGAVAGIVEGYQPYPYATPASDRIRTFGAARQATLAWAESSVCASQTNTIMSVTGMGPGGGVAPYLLCVAMNSVFEAESDRLQARMEWCTAEDNRSPLRALCIPLLARSATRDNDFNPERDESGRYLAYTVALNRFEVDRCKEVGGLFFCEIRGGFRVRGGDMTVLDPVLNRFLGSAWHSFRVEHGHGLVYDAKIERNPDLESLPEADFEDRFDRAELEARIADLGPRSVPDAEVELLVQSVVAGLLEQRRRPAAGVLLFQHCLMHDSVAACLSDDGPGQLTVTFHETLADLKARGREVPPTHELLVELLERSSGLDLSGIDLSPAARP